MLKKTTNDSRFSHTGKILAALLTITVSITACQKHPPTSNSATVTKDAPDNKTTQTADPNWPRPRSDEYLDQRRNMTRTISRRYGLTDPNILHAMQNVPRHWFVPDSLQRSAYADSPLPIGHNQTISQPFIVAYMTHILNLAPHHKVLEIGTGSGYQAAVLNEFTPHIYTIEILAPLADRAQKAFAQHGYEQITAKTGDGYKGWPQHQPFDAIIVTCAPDNIPQPLLDQLKPDGKMIIPVGDIYSIQQLILVTKNPNGKITQKKLMPVRFVPMLREKQN